MSTIQEVSQGAAATAGAAASNQSAETDSGPFAVELNAQLASSSAAAVLERLAAAFPGVTISNADMANFGEVREHYLKSGDAASINVGADMLSRMAGDDAVYSRVETMISTLISAGQRQNLVAAGGSDIHRSVSVQTDEVRYVEVQRTASGTQMSISSLALRTERLIADSLQALTDGSGSQASASATSQTGGMNLFDLIYGNSDWRFEGVLSARGLAAMSGRESGSSVGSAGIDQLTLQRQSLTIEVVVEQWSASSASTGASGLDLLAYIQMMGLSDPLVLDLGDEGINLRSAEDGVYFDIKGDGSPVRTAFIQGNNALLYLDRNGNGLADAAGELFGDYGGFANGYEMLAQYDENGDGLVDANDSAYHELRVWRDLNGDGVNQADESMTLAEAGVASLGLAHDGSMELDAYGNVVADRSSFTRTDGTRGLMVEAWFRTL